MSRSFSNNKIVNCQVHNDTENKDINVGIYDDSGWDISNSFFGCLPFLCDESIQIFNSLSLFIALAFHLVV